jgi:hypothetical protein
MTVADQKQTNRAKHIRGWRWIAVPILIFILSRAAIFTVAGFSLLVDKNLYRHQPALDNNLVIQGLSRWDGQWFVSIARDGYAQAANTNFFPLFPILGRSVSRMTGLSLAAALVLVANLFSLAAFSLVYRIFLDLEDEPTAIAALALLVAWPFSFFQAAAYPESIMMLATALSIYLATRHRHLSAGAVLGTGILARHLTALAGLSLLAQQIKERGLRPSRLILHRDFIGLLLPIAIAWIYLGYLWIHFGDWRVFVAVRGQGWGESAWWGIFHFFTQSEVRRPEIILYLILSIFPAIGAALLLSRSRWRILSAFALGLMLLLYAIGVGGLGRYSASCWPAFLPLGALLANRRVLLTSLICAFAIVQGMMLYLFVHTYTIL